jgi:tRNA(fMet)-specific endonuclease VapC
VILVDTSAWIEFFKGRDPVASSVDAALAGADAALCGPIIAELRRGLRAAQRRRVLALLEGCRVLPDPEDLWVAAGDLGALLARRGSTVKTLDLLIATYAIAHGAPILTTDSDFLTIARANVGLTLAR